MSTTTAPASTTRTPDVEKARAAVAAAYPGAFPEESILDLIADLMHLADVEGLDGGGYRAAKVATGYYADEADLVSLNRLITAVRAAVPQAVTMTVTTSDQDAYGFFLTSLTTAGGQSIEVPDDLVDEASDLLCNITWDGVMHEDTHGDATVSLLA